MELIVYNINSEVYKPNANACARFSRFNPRTSRNFTYVAAIGKSKNYSRLMAVSSAFGGI